MNLFNSLTRWMMKSQGRMKSSHLFLMLIVIVFVINVNDATAVITCQDIADVSIDEWYPDENLNYKDRLIISTNKNIHHGIARGLFLFEVPDDLDASDIRSASIYLSLCSHCGGGDGGDVAFYALNEPFDEATDTWNSLDGGSWDDSVYSEGVIPEGNQWNEAINSEPPIDVEGIDLTTLIKGNLDKVRNNGIMMRFFDEHQVPCTHQNIASKESEDEFDFPPYLIITTQDEQICPAEFMFSGERQTLTSLREFRDKVLSQTLVGRGMVQLYYRLAPFISFALFDYSYK